jgi:hypothetical protein
VRRVVIARRQVPRLLLLGDTWLVVSLIQLELGRVPESGRGLRRRGLPAPCRVPPQPPSSSKATRLGCRTHTCDCHARGLDFPFRLGFQLGACRQTSSTLEAAGSPVQPPSGPTQPHTCSRDARIRPCRCPVLRPKAGACTSENQPSWPGWLRPLHELGLTGGGGRATRGGGLGLGRSLPPACARRSTASVYSTMRDWGLPILPATGAFGLRGGVALGAWLDCLWVGWLVMVMARCCGTAGITLQFNSSIQDHQGQLCL